MKKVLVSSLMFALLAVAAPVSADGGMMQTTTYQPVATNPVVTVQSNPNYAQLVNKILVGVLDMFTWTNDDGEIDFTETNYSAKYDCNTIFGTYSVNLSEMNMGTSAMTKMACDEDEMDADQELAEDFSKVRSFTFEDGQLIMTGLNTELKFTASLPAAE